MAVTVTRISSSTRELHEEIGTLSTELQADSGGSPIMTETIVSQVNLSAPGAKARLYSMHQDKIDDFRQRANDLEAAIASTSDADSTMDSYIAAGNPV